MSMLGFLFSNIGIILFEEQNLTIIPFTAFTTDSQKSCCAVL
jgi:hypothetical protein